MTEQLKYTPEAVSEDEEKEMIAEWEEKLEEKKDELISFKEMRQLMRVAREEDRLRDGTKMEIPGGFSFGTNERLFFTILKHILNEEKAEEILEHEMEHAAVYKKYGVPYSLNIAISVLESGNTYNDPFVAPEFPDDMLSDERIRISRESLGAVTKMSVGDADRMRKIKE